MAKKSLIEIVGRTTEGKPVVDFFFFYDSMGIPLDMALDTVHGAGFVPDWCGFYDKAVAAGWNAKSALIKLESAVLEVYGPEYLASWQIRMKLHLRGS